MDEVSATANVAVHPATPPRGAAWMKWLTVFSVIVSFPLILMGLWISLSLSEPVYHFILEFGPAAHFTDWQWRIVVACRILAWLIFLLSVLQIILIGWTLWAGVRSRPANLTRNPRRQLRFIALVLGVLVLLGMESFWINQMMPTAGLLRAIQNQPSPYASP